MHATSLVWYSIFPPCDTLTSSLSDSVARKHSVIHSLTFILSSYNSLSDSIVFRLLFFCLAFCSTLLDCISIRINWKRFFYANSHYVLSYFLDALEFNLILSFSCEIFFEGRGEGLVIVELKDWRLNRRRCIRDHWIDFILLHNVLWASHLEFWKLIIGKTGNFRWDSLLRLFIAFRDCRALVQ